MASYVYVKNPNGRTYVYENTSYWDKETKTVKHIRKSVGHLDPSTGEILANRKKGDAARKKSEMEQQASEKNCVVSNTGIKKLLDKAVSDTGLKDTLASTFPNDWERILTCAYYLVSEGNALCHVSSWQKMYDSPCQEPLISQRISELLARLTPTRQQEFFSKWMATSDHKNDFYAMDITSVSSYSKLIDFVRWGYNRDGEELPQINLLMLTGVTSHMPLYYRIIPGSIKDVNALKDSLANISILDQSKYHFVTDKGFYSEQNLDALYSSHMKFLIGVPFTAGFAREAVERHRETIRSHHNYCMVYEDELYAVTETTKWKGHRLYIHIYYDSYKAALEEKKFDHTLYTCKEELLSGRRIKEHASYYEP